MTRLVDEGYRHGMPVLGVTAVGKELVARCALPRPGHPDLRRARRAGRQDLLLRGGLRAGHGRLPGADRHGRRQEAARARGADDGLPGDRRRRRGRGHGPQHLPERRPRSRCSRRSARSSTTALGAGRGVRDLPDAAGRVRPAGRRPDGGGTMDRLLRDRLLEGGPRLTVGMLTADLLQLGDEMAVLERSGRRARPRRRHGRRLLPDADGRPAGRQGDPHAAPQGRPPDGRRPAGQGRRVRRGRRRHDHVPHRGRAPAAPRPPGPRRGAANANDPERGVVRGVAINPSTPVGGDRAAARRARLRAHPGRQSRLGRPGVPPHDGAPARPGPPSSSRHPAGRSCWASMAASRATTSPASLRWAPTSSSAAARSSTARAAAANAPLMLDQVRTAAGDHAGPGRNRSVPMTDLLHPPVAIARDVRARPPEYGSAIGRPRSELVTPALVLDLPSAKRNIARMGDRIARAAGRDPARTSRSTRARSWRGSRSRRARSACRSPRSGRRSSSSARGSTTSSSSTPSPAPRKIAAAGRAGPRGRRHGRGRRRGQHRRAVRPPPLAAGSELGVLVEVDTGMDRCGVDTVDEALALARRVAGRPGLRLAG